MDYANKLKYLGNILRKSRKVHMYDSENEKEADRLAHSLLDMQESFREIYESLLPQLTSENIDEEKIDNVLYEIGEELRHILYHIKDPRFYSYLAEENH
jgi:hypothetical protein